VVVLVPLPEWVLYFEARSRLVMVLGCGLLDGSCGRYVKGGVSGWGAGVGVWVKKNEILEISEYHTRYQNTRIRLAAINTIKSSNRLKIESEGHRHLYLSSTSYSIEWKQTTFGILDGSDGMAMRCRSIFNFCEF
jgi:hypothetical protein